MRVTVGLRKNSLSAAGELPDLGQIIEATGSATVVKVFGRGRFASIETSPEGLDSLRQSFGNVCVFTRTPKAVAF